MVYVIQKSLESYFKVISEIYVLIKKGDWLIFKSTPSINQVFEPLCSSLMWFCYESQFYEGYDLTLGLFIVGTLFL